MSALFSCPDSSAACALKPTSAKFMVDKRELNQVKIVGCIIKVQVGSPCSLLFDDVRF